MSSAGEQRLRTEVVEARRGHCVVLLREGEKDITCARYLSKDGRLAGDPRRDPLILAPLVFIGFDIEGDTCKDEWGNAAQIIVRDDGAEVVQFVNGGGVWLPALTLRSSERDCVV